MRLFTESLNVYSPKSPMDFSKEWPVMEIIALEAKHSFTHPFNHLTNSIILHVLDTFLDIAYNI